MTESQPSPARGSERTRRAIEGAAVHADKVSKTFWLFDLKFESFVAPRLVSFIWALYLLLIVFSLAGGIFYALWVLPVIPALISIVFQLVGAVFLLMIVRVVLEMFLLSFRKVELMKPLEYLAYLRRIAHNGQGQSQ